MGQAVSAASSTSSGGSQPASPPPVPQASTTTTAKRIDAELVRLFERIDADHDGRILASEIQQLCGYMATEVKEMVATMDSDGDGFIGIEEFRALMEDGESDALCSAFKVFDENGDGMITAEELCKGLRRVRREENRTVEECSEMIAVVDKDGDGLVSFDEFKAMMASKSP